MFSSKMVAIVPVENLPLETKTPMAAEMAIRAGAGRRGWVPEVVSPEVVRCRLDNRGHLVMVDVVHGASSFSVRYAGSANMLYDEATGSIHRKYNQWVANLASDIQRAAFTQVPPKEPAGAVPPAGPVPLPPEEGAQEEDGVEARLRKLAGLRDAGLITEEECAARRREILESL